MNIEDYFSMLQKMAASKDEQPRDLNHKVSDEKDGQQHTAHPMSDEFK